MISLVEITRKIAETKILVVGDVMLDRYWHGTVTRISPEAPVPIVLVSREDNRLGGAANVALNAKSLGAEVTLISMVGADDAAKTLKRLLDASKIQAHLGEDPGMDTIVKLRIVSRTQQMIRIDFEKEPDHEVLAAMEKLFEAQIAQHDVVIFSDYGKGGLAHILRMIKCAKEAGKRILIDPKGRDYDRYSGADVITPNLSELAQVIGSWQGENQLDEKVEELRSRLCVESILLTRSDEGMTLFENGKKISVPAYAREVIDVTGAGDTVIATLGVMMAIGFEIREAMLVANRAGGVVVGKFGAATATVGELFS